MQMDVQVSHRAPQVVNVALAKLNGGVGERVVHGRQGHVARLCSDTPLLGPRRVHLERGPAGPQQPASGVPEGPEGRRVAGAVRCQ